MSGQAVAVQGWPLLLLALVVSPLVSTPTGPFPALVPRRWRWWYRKHRHHGVRSRQRSARISARLRRRVLRADRYRCVYCGSQVNVQVDHIVPWSVGGLTCLWNLAVLCAPMNKVKSNYWVAGNGRRYYRPFRGQENMHMAREILAAELRARRNPMRWVRAFIG